MRLQVSRIALCAAPGGSGPLKYEDQAWAELLVFSVPRPTSSSISGNAPEWRYLGPHRALPGFGRGLARLPPALAHPSSKPPRGSFSSPVRYPVAGVCQVRISEPWKREPVDVPCCGFSFVAVRVSRSPPTARRICESANLPGAARQRHRVLIVQ